MCTGLAEGTILQAVVPASASRVACGVRGIPTLLQAVVGRGSPLLGWCTHRLEAAGVSGPLLGRSLSRPAAYFCVRHWRISAVRTVRPLGSFVSERGPAHADGSGVG